MAPKGGLLSGTSAVIALDGWTWEDLTLKAPVGVHVQWPQMAPRRGFFGRFQTDREQNNRRDEALKQLSETMDNARAYWTAKKARRSARLRIKGS